MQWLTFVEIFQIRTCDSRILWKKSTKLLFQLAVVIYLPAPFLTFREHLPNFFPLYCPVNLFTVATETKNITKGYFAQWSKAPRLRGRRNCVNMMRFSWQLVNEGTQKKGLVLRTKCFESLPDNKWIYPFQINWTLPRQAVFGSILCVLVVPTHSCACNF